MAKRNPTCGEAATCNEVKLNWDPCCRRIPRRLCATLAAYDCDCDGRTTFMELDENNEYTGSIYCGGETMDLRVLLYHVDDHCYWRVISEEFYFDELFEIGGAGQSCQEPNLEIEALFYECPGTVTIERYEEAVIPLVEDENGSLVPYCGDCRCACKTLCVVRSEDGYITKEEIDWDGGGWGDIRLERDEYTGECIAVVEGKYDKYEPVEVEDCGTEIALLFEDKYSDDFLSAICKKCKCRQRLFDCCEGELPEVLRGTLIPDANCPCSVVQFTLRLVEITPNLPGPPPCTWFTEVGAPDERLFVYASDDVALCGLSNFWFFVAPCGGQIPGPINCEPAEVAWELCGYIPGSELLTSACAPCDLPYIEGWIQCPLLPADALVKVIITL